MGLLDEAIREHLDLMRRHGANEAEIARREAEALGPVLREGEAPESGSTGLPAAEGESALPYDRAAEAGLTSESDVPSFEWQGSSGTEPEVPSFVSPEPVRHSVPEPDGAESPADAEVASDPTETYGVVEPDPAAEEFSVEPGVPEAEVTLQEDRSAELAPEPSQEGAAPEPPEEAAPEPEDSLDVAPPDAPHQPSQPERSFDPAPSGSLEPSAEPALPEGQTIEPPVPTEAEDRFAEAPPLEDETAFRPAPTEGGLEASHGPDSPESFPGVGSEAAEEPALPPPDQEPPEDEATAFDRAGTPEPPPAEVEDLPPEPGPVTPEAGPLTLEPEDLPPEQEPPPLTAGEAVEEPPVDLGLGEPPINLGPGEPPI